MPVGNFTLESFGTRKLARAISSPIWAGSSVTARFASGAFAWNPATLRAIGQFGSFASIERLIQTIKRERIRRLLVPYSKVALQTELSLFCTWYNGERSHERLVGATPDEVYGGIARACAKPRFEPRRKWPARSPCAAPHAKIDGRRGARLDLRVSYLAGRKHLPIVSLARVA